MRLEAGETAAEVLEDRRRHIDERRRLVRLQHDEGGAEVAFHRRAKRSSTSYTEPLAELADRTSVSSRTGHSTLGRGRSSAGACALRKSVTCAAKGLRSRMYSAR